MAKPLAQQIFDDLTNAGFIPDRLEDLAISPEKHERAMKVIDESVLTWAQSSSEPDGPAWCELTQLQRMKFGSEEEYAVHCRKWDSDPAYRENNPYLV